MFYLTFFNLIADIGGLGPPVKDARLLSGRENLMNGLIDGCGGGEEGDICSHHKNTQSFFFPIGQNISSMEKSESLHLIWANTLAVLNVIIFCA